MSFGDAFNYPFKNVPKVLTVVLVFTILVAVLVAMAMNSRSSDGFLLLTFGTIIAQSLFLTGYGIRIIREIQDGYDMDMPSFDIINDIGRGIVVCFAGFITFLPLVIFAVCASTMFVTSSSGYGYSSGIDGATIMLLLLMIPFAVYLGWGFMVGMLRYASEEESGAMFQFGTNFGYVNSNLGSAFSLLGYQILLGIIYAIVNFVVSGIYQSTVISSVTFRTDQTIILAIVTVSYILSIVISLFQQFAGLHLMAQFGEKIGITREPYEPEKAKH